MEDKSKLSEWREAYDQAYSAWNAWLVEAKKDLEFYLGDQWTAQEKAYLRQQRRQILSFNKIRRVVHLVEGYQRKNRLSIKVDPIEGSDITAARQMSGLLQYLFQQAGGYELMSDAFAHGSLKVGLNLLEIYCDYGSDPVSGDLQFARLPYNQFLLDPTFHDRSLKDCRYILRRKWVNKDEAKAILPGHDKEIDEITPRGQDNRYTFAYPMKDLKGKDLGRIDEIYLRTKKKKYRVVNEMTGEITAWPGSKAKLDELLKRPSDIMGMNYGQFIKPMPYWADAVDQVIFYEEQVFYDDSDVLGIDDYPFVPVMGFWDPEYDKLESKLQGLVRCMRDPQTEVNRRRSKMVDILDGVLSSGWMAKTGSVVDPESLYQTGQGGVIWKSPNSQQGDIEQVPPPQIPAGLFQSIEILDKDIVDIPGANAELFGSPENEKMEISGILSKMRQSAGLTILQNLFDNLRHSNKLLAVKCIKAVQVNYDQKKMAAILSEQPHEQVMKPDLAKYDCVPVEGLLTDTQRQMYFAQLMQFKQLGAPIPWAEILEASTIEFKERLLKVVKQMEQAQMQQAQGEAQSKAVTDQLIQAEAMNKAAKARAEAAKMEKDFASAGLDRAKAITEIQGMTFDRLLELVKVALAMEQGQGAGQGNVVPMKRNQMITRR